MTPLDDYQGLLELMLREADGGRTFLLNDVPCQISERDGDALFEAVTADFGVALFFPGWYLGGMPKLPVAIGIAGDYEECFRWLPISPGHKREIIKCLPITDDLKTLLFLTV